MRKKRQQWSMNYENFGLTSGVLCKSFSDPDNGEGVDVYVDGKYAGEYMGINVPDAGNAEQIKLFEKTISDWLDNNDNYQM